MWKQLLAERMHDIVSYANHMSLFVARLTWESEDHRKDHNREMLKDYAKMLKDAVESIDDYLERIEKEEG